MRIANDHCDTERLSLKSLGNLRPRKSAHLSWRGELVPVERRVGEQRQICWLVSHYDECVKSDTSPDFSLCDQRIVPSLRPLSQPPQRCGIAPALTSRGRFGLARVSRGGGAPPYRDALATPPGSRRGQSFLAIAVRIACRQPNKPRCRTRWSGVSAGLSLLLFQPRIITPLRLSSLRAERDDAQRYTFDADPLGATAERRRYKCQS